MTTQPVRRELDLQRIAQAEADFLVSKERYRMEPSLENKNNVEIDRSYLMSLEHDFIVS